MSISASDTIQCDRCGSERHRRHGFKLLSLRRVQQYQCKDCGKLFCAGDEEMLPPLPENLHAPAPIKGQPS
jgi:transposase-like protein